MRSLDLKTVTEKDGKRYVVSTVSMDMPADLFPRLGYTHETMVFAATEGAPLGDLIPLPNTLPVEDYEDLDCTRYRSEDDAKLGHLYSVVIWSDPVTA